MKVLVACEFSGTVRDAFIALGHEAMSCDLLPTEAPGPHYEGDVRDVLGESWDLMVCHPDCTYLCVSGIHWNNRGRGWTKTEEALAFVRTLMDAPIPRIALENPVSIISSRIRKPDQIIQPWQFGHDASKATCLWLKNLPKLTPTRIVEPRLVNGKKRWANQTDSGQNRLPPSEDRWKLRAITYQGIADAMASQWSESGLSLQTSLNLAPTAESRGATSITSTMQTVPASGQATPKTMDGNLKSAMGCSSRVVLNPPSPWLLMRALSQR